MDLDDLSAFALVAVHGSITKASQASGQPKANLSRKLVKLEADLGVRLFERGARSITLTEEGEQLKGRTSGPLADLREIGSELRDGRPHPCGRLRVNVPILFGHLLMGRLAGEFARQNPEVRLEVTIDDREVDPVTEGFDVVVRVNPSRDDVTLVGRCFARDRMVVVAASSLPVPSLGSGEPAPAVVRMPLKQGATWRMGSDGEKTLAIRQVLKLPSLLMVRDAVLTGVGAARLPRVLVADDIAAGRLACWGAISEPPFELWALHVSRRLASARVKAFLRFLENAFPDGWLSRDDDPHDPAAIGSSSAS